jgi:hypothetical protein
MGVNKKNLETYSKTFQFITQSRIEKIPGEERFMRALSLSLVMGGRNILLITAEVIFRVKGGLKCTLFLANLY